MMVDDDRIPIILAIFEAVARTFLFVEAIAVTFQKQRAGDPAHNLAAICIGQFETGHFRTPFGAGRSAGSSTSTPS
ncbi:hypothetical protein [Acetobacter indonesiensis]